VPVGWADDGQIALRAYPLQTRKVLGIIQSVGGDSWRIGPVGTLRVVTTLSNHRTARKQVVVYSCVPHLV
jgi:hypothetical protein